MLFTVNEVVSFNENGNDYIGYVKYFSELNEMKYATISIEFICIDGYWEFYTEFSTRLTSIELTEITNSFKCTINEFEYKYPEYFI